MKSAILLSISTLAVTATMAVAGGYVAPVIEVAPVAVVPTKAERSLTDWTGLYGGLQFGAAKLKTTKPQTPSEGEKDAIPPYPATWLPSGLDTSGRHYGVHLGYLHDFGRYVGGVELAYDKLQSFEDGEKSFGGNLFRGKLLAGYDAGRFLPYAAIGYGRVELDAPTGKDSESGFGYGLGVKYMATPKIMIGAEWMRYDFDWTLSRYQSGGAAPKGHYMDGEAKIDTFGLSVSYRF